MSNDRTQWLAERRKFIGGSDSAKALGISKWGGPLDVYFDKRGESEPLDDNPAMYWGRVLEPIVRDEYARRSGQCITYGEGILRSEAYPFMGANLDGRGADGRVVEIKTARSADGWGDEGSADIPANCLSRHLTSASACNNRRERAIAPGRLAAETAAAVAAGGRVIDPTDWMCTPSTCPVIVGDILLYRDADHLTTEAADFLMPLLRAALFA